jgi:hypothetical protein
VMLFFAPQAAHYVLPTERRVLQMRHHWVTVLPVLLQSIALLAVLDLVLRLFSQGEGMWLFDSVLWYAQIAVILRLAWKLAKWWDDILIITDERFMRVSGVITSRVDMLPVKKLTDMTFNRSFWGLLFGRFGWGSIRVESAGQVQALEYLPYISHPDTVFEAIAKLVFSKDLPAPKTGKKSIGRKLRNVHTSDDQSNEWPVD